MTTYFSELCKAMTLLETRPNSIFLGQAVTAEGTAMYHSLSHIDINKRLELPVFEDCQLGMSIGLSLGGYLPICIFPRINFLLLAINQLILHLDKIPLYSDFKPKVIIRTAIATDNPLNPGPQHLGDYSHGLIQMLDKISVFNLFRKNNIMPAYKYALQKEGSSLIIEYMDRYSSE